MVLALSEDHDSVIYRSNYIPSTSGDNGPIQHDDNLHGCSLSQPEAQPSSSYFQGKSTSFIGYREQQSHCCIASPVS